MAPEGMKYPALESTPILAEGGSICSSRNRRVDPKLAARSGHDLQIDMRGLHLLNCRGVTYLTRRRSEGRGASRPHHHGHARWPSARARRSDRRPCAGFGKNGALDLRAGLGRNRPGDYAISWPPVVVGNLIIVGGRRGFVPHRHAGRCDPCL
jgi:hypothetical protein